MKKNKATMAHCKIVLITAFLFFGLLLSGCATKNEGSVEWNDCREKIKLNDDQYNSSFKDFTCMTQKTKTGKIMSGVCVNVEIVNNICNKAYYYELKPELTCGENEYLTWDEKCNCNYGTYFNANTNKCE